MHAWGKFLTFRATAEDYDRFGWTHLGLGILGTLLVGVARNWDYPQALLVARFGLFSLAYIIVMSALLFVIARPVSGQPRGYFYVLTIVAMTSAPGLLYGIPVEMMMPLEQAQQVNMWFLFIVATWRVALALHAFKHGFLASSSAGCAALFLPVLMILAYLVASERVVFVFEMMGGLRERTPTSQDAADGIVALLGVLAFPMLVVGVIWYGIAVYRTRQGID